MRASDARAAFLAIALPAKHHEPLLEEALHASAAGLRVYLLGPPSFGGSIEVHGRLKDHAGRVLVRRGVELPYGLTLAGRGLEGSVRSPGWTLPLSAAQASAAFAAFAHLFWHHAPEELSGGADGFRFRSSPSPPEASPLPSERGAVHFGAIAPADASLHLVLSRGLQDRRSAAARTWVPALPKTASALAASAAGRVTWTDAALPAIAASGNGATIGFGEGSRWPLLVRLEADQARALAAALDGAPVEWELRREVRLADLRGELLHGDSPRPQTILPSVTISAGEITAARIEDMAIAAPTELPAPPPLALKVIYQWKIHPVTAPPRSEPAKLVRDWTALDDQVRTRIEEQRRLLEELRTRGEGFRNRFARIAGEMLGFRRSLDDLETALRSAGAEPPSRRGPQGAADLCRELSHIEDELSRIDKEQRQTVDRAEEDEDREQQESEHLRKQESASARAKDLAGSLARAEQQLQEVRAALEAAAREPPSPDRKTQQKKLGDEKQKLEKQVRALQQEKQTAEQQRDAPFRFERRQARAAGAPRTEAAKKRPAFVPTEAAPSSPVIPREALPACGLLQEHQGRRYLVVGTWEEYAAAEADALRLNALRVAGGGE
ncbi:hypothetical protein [Sorangium sp. So ce128]|uniref:hypothetical protein n=1 Tax=Sorangium sp. So ce128 TaxID=3133281 RepID=UPI003F61AF29